MIYKTQIKNKPQHKLSMSSQMQFDMLSFLCFCWGYKQVRHKAWKKKFSADSFRFDN